MVSSNGKGSFNSSLLKKEEKNKPFYIFVSFDVVNSTNLKYLKDLKLTSFNEELEESYKTIEDVLVSNPEVGLKLWKFLGDEFIFYSEITFQNAVTDILNLSKKALNEVNDSTECLKFKCTSWMLLADNKDNIFISSENEKLNSDFIGREMDIGFRLSKASLRNRVVIDLFLVNILYNILEIPKYVYYMGEIDLKGVWGSDAYPVFFFETDDIDFNYYEKRNEFYGKAIKSKIYEYIKTDDVLDSINNNESWKLNKEWIRQFKDLPVNFTSGKERPVHREELKKRIEFHVATIIYNYKTDKILLAKRSTKKDIKPGLYECGGGVLFETETICKCAERKANEEFKIKVKPIKEINDFYYIDNYSINGIQLFCITEEDKYEIDQTQHSEIKWVSVSELSDYDEKTFVSDYLKSSILNFVEKYKKNDFS